MNIQIETAVKLGTALEHIIEEMIQRNPQMNTRELENHISIGIAMFHTSSTHPENIRMFIDGTKGEKRA